MAALRSKVRLTPASTSLMTPLGKPPGIRVNPSSFSCRKYSCTSAGRPFGRVFLQPNRFIDASSVCGATILIENEASYRRLQVSCRFMPFGTGSGIFMKALTWLNEAEFTVEGIKFQCCVNDYTQKTTDERFILLKDRGSLEQYATVLTDAEPRNVLEFGIFQGGSAALFTAWFDLEKFVGIDICASVGPFDNFCRTHEMGQRIRSYYGVSQTDAARIREIAQSEFGTKPIDLIIDDASHLYRTTRRTFEIAFPLLRPGGIYVVE